MSKRRLVRVDANRSCRGCGRVQASGGLCTHCLNAAARYAAKLVERCTLPQEAVFDIHALRPLNGPIGMREGVPARFV